MSEFAKGYYDLYRGELREALIRFTKLTNTQEGQVWGCIGILEYALYTESIEHMKGTINVLRNVGRRDSPSVPSWVLSYYSAWYKFYSGNFSEVDKIIRESDKLLYSLTTFLLRVNLLVRENYFKEAEEAIKNLPADLLNDQSVIALESEIIGYKYGPDRQIKYLQEKYERFPKMWLIEQQFAEALEKSDQIRLGFDIFKKLVQNRPFDIMSQVDLLENLWDYEKGEKENEEFKKIFMSLLNNPNSIQIPKYNILLAEIYHVKGQKKKAQRHLNIASELNPKYPRLLWQIFNFAMEKHDYFSAYKAIKEILELYPNEVSALVSLMELSYLRGEWKVLSEAEEKIRRSNRYIDEKTWDKIRSFKALALAEQGKISEAKNTLGEIKEREFRDKTSSEIDRLRKK